MLAEVYTRSLTEGQLSLYFDVLSKYQLEEVYRAIHAHVSDPERGQFFPKPADLIRFIEGDPQTNALLAWTEAERAIVEVGAYDSVEFADRVTNQVIADMGGWPTFGGWSDHEWPFKRKEFCDRYRAIKQVGRVSVGYLPGLHEATNRGVHPESVPERVLIGGDERKALPE